MSETRAAVAAGGAAALAFVAAYALGLTIRRRPDVLVALVYNAPVASLFLVSLAYLVVQGVRGGLSAALRAHAGTLLIWTVGFVVLYLRLVSKSVEVSGHLTWLPMLTAQLWVWRFPTAVVAFGACSALVAVYLKMAVFQGPSGIPGLVAGLSLATGVLILSRMREHRAVEQ